MKAIRDSFILPLLILMRCRDWEGMWVCVLGSVMVGGCSGNSSSSVIVMAIVALRRQVCREEGYSSARIFTPPPLLPLWAVVWGSPPPHLHYHTLLTLIPPTTTSCLGSWAGGLGCREPGREWRVGGGAGEELRAPGIQRVRMEARAEEAVHWNSGSRGRTLDLSVPYEAAGFCPCSLHSARSTTLCCYMLGNIYSLPSVIDRLHSAVLCWKTHTHTHNGELVLENNSRIIHGIIVCI